MKHNLHVSGEESPVFRHGEYVNESLLERVKQGNSEGVVSRILNLDQEMGNESYCDWVIDNNQEPELVAKQLLQSL